MVGRMAWQNTWAMAKVDEVIYGEVDENAKTREQIIRTYAEYAAEYQKKALEEWGSIKSNSVLSRPLYYMFTNELGASRWRKALNEGAQNKALKMDVKTVIENALEDMRSLNPDLLTVKRGVIVAAK